MVQHTYYGTYSTNFYDLPDIHVLRCVLNPQGPVRERACVRERGEGVGGGGSFMQSSTRFEAKSHHF
jgi:hypothetical protein